jgi:hypothetical protein
METEETSDETKRNDGSGGVNGTVRRVLGERVGEMMMQVRGKEGREA